MIITKNNNNWMSFEDIKYSRKGTDKEGLGLWISDDQVTMLMVQNAFIFV